MLCHVYNSDLRIAKNETECNFSREVQRKGEETISLLILYLEASLLFLHVVYYDITDVQP